MKIVEIVGVCSQLLECGSYSSHFERFIRVTIGYKEVTTGSRTSQHVDDLDLKLLEQRED